MCIIIHQLIYLRSIHVWMYIYIHICLNTSCSIGYLYFILYICAYCLYPVYPGSNSSSSSGTDPGMSHVEKGNFYAWSTWRLVPDPFGGFLTCVNIAGVFFDWCRWHFNWICLKSLELNHTIFHSFLKRTCPSIFFIEKSSPNGSSSTGQTGCERSIFSVSWLRGI